MISLRICALVLSLAAAPACILFGLQPIPCRSNANCPTGDQCIFDRDKDGAQADIGQCFSPEQLAASQSSGSDATPDRTCDGDQCCAQSPCRRMPDSSSYCADPGGPLPDPPASGAEAYGQDCSYRFSQHDFASEEVGQGYWDHIHVIHDHVTALTWQAKPGLQPMNADRMPAACSRLYDGEGRFSWRPPGLHELMSLVDYGTIWPAWPEGAPQIPDDVSTLAYAAGSARPNYIGQIEMNEGQVSVVSDGGSYYLLCVSGDAWGCAQAGEIGQRDDEIEDLRSGLIWARQGRAAQRWTGALAYCESLQLAGHSDWRLPSAKELATIVDLNRADQDVKVCAALQAGLDWQASADRKYWSSTPYLSPSVHQAWLWDLQQGRLAPVDMSGDYDVRCVRTRGP